MDEEFGSLEDFIPVYPEGSDEDIQVINAKKQEFLELASSMREEVPIRGELYLNQKLFIRFMMANDRCLNISETGVGKSCQIVGLRESLRKSGSYIKHAYVLQKPSTMSQFKYQILCKCTAGEYETEMVKRAQSEKSRRSNITREIGKWYSVMSYYTFAKEAKKLSDAQIVEKYSGCLFAIDEAHNLRNEGKSAADQSLSETYETIKRVLHLVKRSKIVISTATPLINGVKDFARIANLALPASRQLPEDWDYSKVTLEQLEPYLRNIVFYMRSLDTGAVPTYQGSVIDYTHGVEYPAPGQALPPISMGPQPDVTMVTREIPSQTVIYALTMGDIQDAAYRRFTYLRLTDGALAGLEPAEEAEGTHFHTGPRQVSSFVFPDGSFGGSFPRKGGSRDSGIGKYILSTSDNNYEMTPEFRAAVSDPATLQRLSSKYARIIQIESTEVGCGFCYTDLVSGSGAITLGMCFEANRCMVMGGLNFERFNERSSIFTSHGSRDRGVCVSPERTRTVRSNFPKRPRYALLTGETPPNVVDSMLEVMTSPENIDGEYIKIIIVSPVGRDGINIYHVLRGHLVTAGWHPSGMHQALSRFMRSVSHDDLIRRERQRLIADGRNPSEATIEVKVYKHAAVPREIGGQESLSSVDVDLYQYAESKSIPIHRIMRMLKQIDFGCRINYGRNVRETDVDGTEVCDYDACRYVCVSGPISADGRPTPVDPRDIDYTTYDILYSDSVVDACIREILYMVRERGMITFDQLRQEWVVTGLFRQKFIYMAVERLLNEKLAVLDRFGFSSYIQTDGHNIYTQREFPIMSLEAQPRELARYGEEVIGVTYTDFETLADLQQVSKWQALMRQIKAMPQIESVEQVETFNRYVTSLNAKVRSQLLEDAIMISISKPPDEFPAYVLPTLKRFQFFVLWGYEPWEDLIKAQGLLSEGKNISKRQNPAQGKTRVSFTSFTGFSPPDSLDSHGKPVEMVYIHSLYSISTDLTAYSAMANFINVNGTIRIYKASWGTRGFRDANKTETPVYREIFQKQRLRLIAPYRQFPIFGSIIPDGRLRLHKGGQFEGSDTRSWNKGQICSIHHTPALIGVLFSMRDDRGVHGIPAPDVEFGGTRDQLIQYLQNKPTFSKNSAVLHSYSDADLVYLYKWFHSSIKRSQICALIKSYLLSQNRILTIEDPS